jgi:hypothetical protein
VVILHGALPLGAVVFSSVAARARNLNVWRHCIRRRGSKARRPTLWRRGKY